jgi:hypothetical protein
VLLYFYYPIIGAEPVYGNCVSLTRWQYAQGWRSKNEYKSCITLCCP